MPNKEHKLRQAKELAHPSIWNVDTNTGAPRPAQGPANVGQSGFSRLATGLQNLQPGLTSFLEQKHEAWTQEQITSAGQAYEANRMGWKELVEKHPEYRDKSPHFRRAYHAADLRNNTRAFEHETMQELFTNPTIQVMGEDGEMQEQHVLASDNPDHVQQLISERWNQFQQNNPSLEDPTLLAENLERLENLQANALRYHSKVRDDAYRYGVQKGLHKESIGAVADLADAGGLTMTEDRVNAGYTIKEMMDGYLADGLTKQEANATVTNAIISYAVETMDEDILDTINHIPTGTGFLGGVPGVRASIEAARNQIDDRKWQQEQRDYTRTQREDAAFGAEALSRGMEFADEGDYTQARERYEDLLERNKHQEAATLGRYMDVMKQGKSATAVKGWDDTVRASLEDSFYMDRYTFEEKREAIINNANEGNIGPDTMRTMMDQARADHAKLITSKGKAYTDQVEYLAKGFTANIESKYGFEPVNQEEAMIQRGIVIEFENAAIRAYTEWADENQTQDGAWQPSLMEVHDFFHDTTTKLLRNPRFAVLNEDGEADAILTPGSGKDAWEQTKQLETDREESVAARQAVYNETITGLIEGNYPDPNESYIPDLGISVNEMEDGSVEFYAADGVTSEHIQAFADHFGFESITEFLEKQAQLGRAKQTAQEIEERRLSQEQARYEHALLQQKKESERRAVIEGRQAARDERRQTAEERRQSTINSPGLSSYADRMRERRENFKK